MRFFFKNQNARNVGNRCTTVSLQHYKSELTEFNRDTCSLSNCITKPYRFEKQTNITSLKSLALSKIAKFAVVVEVDRKHILGLLKIYYIS